MSIACSSCGANAPQSTKCKGFEDRTCPVCLKLADMDVEIREVRARLQRLLENRRTVELITNQRHDPFTNLLPPELASQIMLMTSSYQVEVSRLSSVSHRWRSIAISTPQLWTLISRRTYRDPDILAEWVKRSGEQPLSISLSFINRNSFAACFTALHVLNSCSHRWLKLELDMPATLVCYLQGNSSGRSILQNLVINSSYRDNPTFALDNFIPSPPRLQYQGIHFDQIKIDYGSLTHIIANHPQLAECIEIFRQCDRLEELEIHGSSDFDRDLPTPPPPSQTFVLASLRLLHIHHSMETAMYSHLTVPALVDFDASVERGAVDALIAMFERSKPPLKKLGITGPGSEELLLQILESVPSVEELNVDMYREAPLSNSFFDRFSSTAVVPNTAAPSDRYLPYLEKMEISTDVDFSWSNVIQIFSSDPPPQGCHRRPLSMLYLIVTDYERTHYIDRPTLTKIFDLAKSGIRIFIVDNSDFGNNLVECSRRFHDDGETYETAVATP